MAFYALVETDDGYTVVQYADDETAEDAALKAGGVLIDPGPYSNYEEAYDALEQLEVFDEEDQT